MRIILKCRLSKFPTLYFFVKIKWYSRSTDKNWQSDYEYARTLHNAMTIKIGSYMSTLHKQEALIPTFIRVILYKE
ncbi:MAG: hypothetical protein ACD_2C00025G0003 [uncultured bacterium (gcode 4)]|uniref:Uncharacterized protein n=1 Tax=uncultured bacterium (gcode 4) TaxID=1234023 RepID=K2G794_9BACT|nr:MAG: hypothetical protein ACD_2C00025G0003 [uncultured bacterium (gcode 4)]